MMKIFAVIGILAIAGVALGFYRGWFSAKTNPVSTGNELVVKVDPDKFKKDKAAYQKKAEAELKELDGQMETLHAKAKVASGEAKIQMDKDLEILKHKKEAAGKKLGEIEEASADKWDVVKSNIEADFADLKKGFASFIARHK